MKNDTQFGQKVSTPRPYKRWLMPIGGVLLLAVAGGVWMTMHTNNIGAAVTADAKTQQKKVEVFELSSGDFAQVEARELRVMLPVSGTLNALSQATVKSKVAAEVRDTPVPEGVKVLRGQVIVRLDTADLKARLATQQAAHEEANAKLALAQKNHETNLTLLKQKFISQNAFDTAQNSVESAQAGVKSTASQQDIARRALEDAVVRAPIDGIISKRFVQPGEKAALDMPLFAMVNLAQLILEAQVPASEIPRVQAGQEVAFNVDGFQGRNFHGKVARINPMTEAGTRAMTVYIAVDNADGALKAGMFAKGGITLEKSATLPVLPLVALRQETDAAIVYKIENNRIVAQAVKLGLRSEDEGLAVAAAGLVAGDRVLIVKLDGVKPGSAVKLPQPAAASNSNSE
jgi:membrane fusion protein (multidrug efflux system)